MATNKMSLTLKSYIDYLPPALHELDWRLHPMDGKLLLFERDSGLNVLLEGEETAHFQRLAPRTLLIAVTNACNLTCHFCYRDLQNRSLWSYDSLMQFCRDASKWGVLEVAFGGGEPTVFPRWDDFICELYETSELCINFTSNGLLLTEDFLRKIGGKYGNIRLSLYDDNHYEATIRRMVGCRARFGVNWLITPDELPTIERKFLTLLELGVRDFLLLSYKGNDPSMHLSPNQVRDLSDFLNRMYQSLNGLAELKLDVCWGDVLSDVPRLFEQGDCGASDDFLSITSDKRVKGCSFIATATGQSFETVAELRQHWQATRQERTPAQLTGCARLANRGMSLIHPQDIVRQN